MFSKGESVLWKCVLDCGLRLRKAQGLISKTDTRRGIGLRGPLDLRMQTERKYPKPNRIVFYI